MAGISVGNTHLELDAERLRALSGDLERLGQSFEQLTANAAAAAAEMRRLAAGFDALAEEDRKLRETIASAIANRLGGAVVQMLMPGECQCPNCTARRAAEAAAKRTGLN